MRGYNMGEWMSLNYTVYTLSPRQSANLIEMSQALSEDVSLDGEDGRLWISIRFMTPMARVEGKRLRVGDANANHEIARSNSSRAV